MFEINSVVKNEISGFQGKVDKVEDVDGVTYVHVVDDNNESRTFAGTDLTLVEESEPKVPTTDGVTDAHREEADIRLGGQPHTESEKQAQE